MGQVLQVSHSLRLPKNYIPSLLPSEAEYNEQRSQETSDGVTHSWTDPLRTETQPKPGGGSQAEHLAHDKVHLRWRSTGRVVSTCIHNTHFSNWTKFIQNQINNPHETETVPNSTFITISILRTSPRFSPDPQEFPGTC